MSRWNLFWLTVGSIFILLSQTQSYGNGLFYLGLVTMILSGWSIYKALKK